MTPARRKPVRRNALRPRTKREAQEFCRAKPGLLMCPDCGAICHEKRWKRSLAELKNTTEGKRIVFRRCPACVMIRDHVFEGQVIAEHIPLKRRKEAVRRIHNVGTRAHSRDPLDRIIMLRQRGGRIEVTTTENRLAVRIGREIRDLLRGKLDIRWSHEEDTVRVYWKPA